MFCEKCGAQLDSDSKFCLNCGAPATPQATPAPAPAPAPAAPGFFSNKKNVMIVGIIAAVLVVGIIAAIIIAGLPTTIYMDDFITLEYDGLSTKGTVYLQVNEEALEARLQELMTEQEMNIMLERMKNSSSQPVMKLDKTELLTNGEDIHITFFMDNEIAKDYDVQFKLKNSTITVAGLQEPIFLDLFKDLTLIYTGCSPYADVEIENNSTVEFIQNEVYFYISNNSDLEEGEEFTVEASYSEYSANEAGYIILEDTHTYTASNLPQPEELNPFDHIDIDFTGLNDAGRASVKTQDEDISFMSYIDFSFSKSSSLTEGEIITLSYTVRGDRDPLRYGYTLVGETSQQITVPKLGQYVTDFNQLSPEGQQQIIDKATEVAKLYLTRENAENKTGNVNLVGTNINRGNQLSLATDLTNVKLHSVVACQNSTYSWHTKYVYFFFTVDITGHPNVEGGNTTGAFYLRLSNPIVKGDGTLEVDLDSNYIFSTNSYVYLGMDALNTALESDMINPIIYTPAN